MIEMRSKLSSAEGIVEVKASHESKRVCLSEVASVRRIYALDYARATISSVGGGRVIDALIND